MVLENGQLHKLSTNEVFFVRSQKLNKLINSAVGEKVAVVGNII